MSELELLIQINEKLEAIIIILLVFTVIHYVEKWFKIFISKKTNI